MEQHIPNSALPSIPAKRYFTIGEVSELCGVKAHVLRYWEQEFTQLKPVKRGGNRRYYQHHEVLLIRRIRQLLYEDGFTISGARSRLDQLVTKHEEIKVAPVVTKPVFNTGFNPSELRRDIREVIALLQA
jgi:DNA-binding transcriptional MerR regulator